MRCDTALKGEVAAVLLYLALSCWGLLDTVFESGEGDDVEMRG